MGWSAALPAMGALVRLLALLAFLAFDGDHRIDAYLPFHVAASALGAAAGLFAVRRVLHPGNASTSLSWGDLRQTLPFSLAWFTNASMGSWDKALVLRLAGAELSGLYAVAYRFASFVALPMDSLVMALTPRLFRHGGLGGHDQGLMRYAFTSIVGFGLLACCVVWVFAPVLPWLLGSEFAPSADLVRGIILMIPFYGLRQLGGHVLITHGRRGARIAIDLCALVLMTALAVALIPTRGVVGAIAMIVASEAFLTAMTWIVAVPAIRAARRRGLTGSDD
jgi:O-antigen/teichoic acid export membrane protein